MFKNRNAVFIHLLLISVIVIPGCSVGNQKESVNRPDTSLKVLYYSADSFQYEYGMLLAAIFPDIQFDVIGTNTLYADHDSDEEFDYEAALYNLIDREKPDIMLLKAEQFMKLAGENKLYSLEHLAKQKNFNLEGIAPHLLEYLREMGNGQLYGLANSFNSRALFYNKDLFDRYKIPYPTDQMTWDELFQLAMRFPSDGEGDERIYGLNVDEARNLFDLAFWIGHAENLTLVDTSAKRIMIRSESWKNVFQKALDAIHSGSIYAGFGPAGASANTGMSSGGVIEITVLEDKDPFITGKAAMSLDYSSMVNRIKQAQQQSKNKESIIKNWDMVTVPVGKQAPDRNPYMTMRDIFAIGAESPNKDAAWEVLSYIAGDNYARARAKTNAVGLPTRTAYLNDEEGHHYEAFYLLKPSAIDLPYGNPDQLPKNFIAQFEADARKELERVVNHEVTLEQALADLEQRANMALQAE